MSREQIQAAIPHRDPFLLIDEVVEQSDVRIVCAKQFSGEEFWYRGHYPDYPLTPGVLLCEACLQAGAVLLSKITETAQGGQGNAGGVPVATRLNNVQFREMVRPGDAITVEVDLVEQVSNAFFMKGRVTNQSSGKLAARCEFACTVATPA
ncbi:3-hydroxyacyl-ACP dehydratase FabZ family protein [Botrimarina hoheduenensis]|uniref:3-hydroxyacyl-[acyl-carrier-protein] dehydratase FabZ n=1 Tax=Botrimarina hoheduenensis TaxID=2528000 RepID=A0A5C5WD90_9BACT|nr:3-hydroxyacyl-ACP dehydratase FabZ family protein [Botrimarina hoheduenensis]TWT48650.1 3-hydroxyacyl-[acyl-carrier-protein] dehydratase FabZ [Botrimarina hoheduenensis]